MNFLKVVGNVANDPAKGWTCDFSGDLMLRWEDSVYLTGPAEITASGEFYV